MRTQQRQAAFFVFGLIGTTLLSAPAQAQLNIVIRPDAELAANQAALDAFNRAADQWAARITDPATIVIDAGLDNLGSNVIGQAESVFAALAYDDARSLLIADSAGQADETIVSFLPTFADFRAALPTGFSLTNQIVGTKANFKALGITDFDPTVFPDRDGTITFSTAFSFDYDNRDGVGAGLTDFETVAAHEIGHVLGFVSVVDLVDFRLSQGRTSSIAPYTLDLFRFENNSADDPSSAATFTTAERYLLTGGDAITDDVMSEYRMSTGSATGDGNQASHWKRDEETGTTIGIMDPTLGAGVVTPISEADFRALDLIGYDIVMGAAVVPEPSSVALLLPAAFGLRGVYARRKRATR